MYRRRTRPKASPVFAGFSGSIPESSGGPAPPRGLGPECTPQPRVRRRFGAESVGPGGVSNRSMSSKSRRRCQIARLRFRKPMAAPMAGSVRCTDPDLLGGKLQGRFRAAFGIPLQEVYGLTESVLVMGNPIHAIRPGSMGVPFEGVELRIVDAAGQDVPVGET